MSDLPTLRAELMERPPLTSTTALAQDSSLSLTAGTLQRYSCSLFPSLFLPHSLAINFISNTPPHTLPPHRASVCYSVQLFAYSLYTFLYNDRYCLCVVIKILSLIVGFCCFHSRSGACCNHDNPGGVPGSTAVQWDAPILPALHREQSTEVRC